MFAFFSLLLITLRRLIKRNEIGERSFFRHKCYYIIVTHSFCITRQIYPSTFAPSSFSFPTMFSYPRLMISTPVIVLVPSAMSAATR